MNINVLPLSVCHWLVVESLSAETRATECRRTRREASTTTTWTQELHIAGQSLRNVVPGICMRLKRDHRTMSSEPLSSLVLLQVQQIFYSKT